MPQGSGATSGSECGSDILLRDKKHENQRLLFERRMFEKPLSIDEDDTTKYKLPIVFHIIHQDGPENLSDVDIERSVELLNDAFANEAPFNGSSSVATQISFCLAAKQPDGTFGMGITRRTSTLTDAILETDDASLKGLVQWDPTAYINVWVVRSLSSLNMGSSLAGYAMFPHVHGSPLDGIVIEAGFLGNDPIGARVMIHEMGHYLGLYHTFEGGCKNDDCQLDGDRVCDTPPDASTAGVLCHNNTNSCTTDELDVSTNNPFRPLALGGLGDQPDMHENYMDYGFQECQTTFTEGQRKRMRDAIVNVRYSLLDNPGLCDGCPQPLHASLILPDTVAAGVPVTFQVNTSEPVQLVLWEINGTFQAGNPWIQTFETAQSVDVKVRIINAGCLITLSKLLYVDCTFPVPFSFSASPQDFVSPGETVQFQASTNLYSYTWQVDGIAAGTGPTLNYTVTGTEGKLITLKASNGNCSLTSAPYFLRPGTCTVNKENNTWYFGMGGGIDFNSNPPKAIQGKISTEEGCAVLSDQDGKPIYHSMGASVQNSQTGLTLLNGDNMYGHTSTTQSALFVPQPGNNRYVYLFSVDYQAGEAAGHTGGIYYSVIDRQGDGGKGEVTQKNILLKTPVVEKVTAVKSLNGNGVWVIAHEWNSNAFYAWMVTSSGISGAVVSRVGTVHNSPVPGVGALALGELKSSPSGRKLALAIQGKGLYEYFDFNASTGVVSNPVTLHTGGNVYGVAFSPNERYLYGSLIGQINIVRFDLQAGSPEAVKNSKVSIYAGPTGGGAIQLAPDGRIYCARREQGYLPVINNPNAVDPQDCGFDIYGFKLYGNSRSFYGLPNPVQSVLFSAQPKIVGPQKVCRTNTDTTLRYHVSPVGHATYSWTHHGSNALTLVNDTTVSITFTQSGSDTLIVKRAAPCNDMYDTLYITSGLPVPFDLGPDTLVCKETNWVTLTGPTGYAEYQWSNNNSFTHIASFNPAARAGTIRLRTVTDAGCVAIDSLRIIHRTLPELNLGRDTSLCGTDALQLHAPAGMDSYWWSTGETGTSILVSDQGVYVARVGKYGCLFTDTLQVWKDIPENILSKDTLFKCISSNPVFIAPDGFHTYSWKLPDGTDLEQQQVEVSEEGWYILSYTNSCGTGTDSVLYWIPRMLSQHFYETCDDTLTLVAMSPVLSLNPLPWQANSHEIEDDKLHFYRSGTYLLIGQMTDHIECLISEQIEVLIDSLSVPPAMSIDLGNDTSYCEGKVLFLDAGAGFDRYVWSNGTSERSTTVYGFGQYHVSARYCGHDYSDSIVISRDTSLTIDLGADRFLCSSGSVTLDAGADYNWYRWNTGDQTRTIEVVSAGTYQVEVGTEECIVRDTVEFYSGSAQLTITGDTLLCEHETFAISVHPSVGSYLWDSLSVMASNTSPTLNINRPGVYKVKSSNCPADDWSDSISIVHEIFQTPVFHFSPDSLCQGESVSLTFHSTGYTGFTWSDGTHDYPKLMQPNTSTQLTLTGKKCLDVYSVQVPDLPVKDCDGDGNNGGGDNGGGELPDCTPYFFLAPNPSKTMVRLMNTCRLEDLRLKVTVFSADGKLIAEDYDWIEEIDALLNQLITSLSGSMYIIRLETEFGHIHHLKWLISK